MKRTPCLPELNQAELTVLKKNPLFAGLDKEGLGRMLSAMKAEKSCHERGEMIQSAGRPVGRFGVVLSGAVQVCVDDIEGNRMIMAEVAPGASFGESLCFLRTKESPVYIQAMEETALLRLSTEVLHDADAFDPELHRRFTAVLAGKTLTMNNRIQVLSKLSLRSKLTAYFTELAAEQGSSVIRLPMNRDDTAAYIGANRSALSRELAKMKAEGLIDYRKNQIEIL